MSNQTIRAVFGKSHKGMEIIGFTNRHVDTPEKPLTLLLGGIHGDEPATSVLLERFVQRCLPTVEGRVITIPTMNPDGQEAGSRYNARGVDLNRNFPRGWQSDSVEPSGTAPLSEDESQLLARLITDLEPARIVTLHWALGEVDADGAQSGPLAIAMWESLTPAQQAPYRLRITEDEASAQMNGTPGSLGMWVGWGFRRKDESRCGIVTLELPHAPEASRPEILEDSHLEEVRSRWSADSQGYIEAVWPGVSRMLTRACTL